MFDIDDANDTYHAHFRTILNSTNPHELDHAVKALRAENDKALLIQKLTEVLIVPSQLARDIAAILHHLLKVFYSPNLYETSSQLILALQQSEYDQQHIVSWLEYHFKQNLSNPEADLEVLTVALVVLHGLKGSKQIIKLLQNVQPLDFINRIQNHKAVLEYQFQQIEGQNPTNASMIEQLSPVFSQSLMFAKLLQQMVKLSTHDNANTIANEMDEIIIKCQTDFNKLRAKPDKTGFCCFKTFTPVTIDELKSCDPISKVYGKFKQFLENLPDLKSAASQTYNPRFGARTSSQSRSNVDTAVSQIADHKRDYRQ